MKNSNNKNLAEVERISADPKVGLTSEQAKARAKEGLANISSTKLEKSNARIICENAFTFFNVVLYIIAAMFAAFMIFLSASGHDAVRQEYFGVTKFIFLISVVMNVVIGSFQGIRSKKTLQKLRIVTESKANVIRDGEKVNIPGTEIVLDDILLVAQGDQLGVDAIVLEGEVQVDESLLTGEADLIKKKAGDTLYSGSFVMVGSCRARVEKVGDETYASTLSNKVKSLQSTKSELMVNIYRIINVMSVVLFVIVGVVIGTLVYKVLRWGGAEILGPGEGLDQPTTWARIFVTTASFAIGVIPTGLVLITSVTLAVSIITLSKQQTLIQELYSLENLSRINVICLDKTGTLTDGTMKVIDTHAVIEEATLKQEISKILGVFDSTNMTSKALELHFGRAENVDCKEVIPFSSAKKCSGYVSNGGDTYLMGAPEYIAKEFKEAMTYTESKAKEGRRVIAFTKNGQLLGLVALEDGIRASAKDTITYFYENGVDVKIISGDNAITVSKIAAMAGVRNADRAISLEGMELEDVKKVATEYTIFARVSPEQKQALVEALQSAGKKVAMTGDGVNDILALRRANASITFNNATDAAKSCSNVVLLDNDFSHLKAVVGEGRRVVNNIERTAILFLMKTVAVVSLALALIPFKEGQLSYSLENVYLLETAIIGTGGFLLSLEQTKQPIKGSFGRNVLAKAVPSGIFVFIGAILPVLLKNLGVYGEGTYAHETTTSLISLMTAVAGATVLIAMCIPFNKHRAISAALVIGNVALFALALPRVFIGAKALNFSDMTTIMSEAFQPWNARALQVVFLTSEGAFNSYAFLTLALYFLVGLPVYYLVISIINKYLAERNLDNEEDIKKMVRVVMVVSIIVSALAGLSAIVIGALITGGQIHFQESISNDDFQRAVGVSMIIVGFLFYMGTAIDLHANNSVKKGQMTMQDYVVTAIFMLLTFQLVPLLMLTPYYITHRKNEKIEAFNASVKTQE